MTAAVIFNNDLNAAISSPRPVQPADDPLQVFQRWTITDEQVLKMKDTHMIWRGLLAHQHLAALIGQAGSGKSAIAQFAAAELAPSYRVMFFQEDASAGDLPRLHEHAKAHGYTVLNSTLSGSNTEDQIKTLRRIACNDIDLSDVVMIFDTLKKYADLMSKGGTRAFFTLMRGLTQRGATVLLLGHTNKHRGPDGKLMFEGVGDVRNDVDELLYIESTDKDAAGLVTVTIRPDKVRCVAREASFELDTRAMQVRALDRVVDVAADLADRQQRERDADLIQVITDVLAGGGMGHSELVKRACNESGQGRNAITRVVNRYLGQAANDRGALWLETRIKLNNVRYVSLKPEVQP